MRKENAVTDRETLVWAIRERLSDCGDLKYREVTTEDGTVSVFFIEEIANRDYISANIIEPLSLYRKRFYDKRDCSDALFVSYTSDVADVGEAVRALLAGDTVVIFPGRKGAVSCSTKKHASRVVSKTDIDSSLRGSKESFNETLQDNLSLIRKRICSPDLKIVNYSLGSESQTGAALIYLENCAPKELIDYIKKKIDCMQSRFVLSSENLAEQLQTDNSSFYTFGSTEKPDTLIARLYEGRVAVIVNGSPFIMTAPYFFIENFQASDDYFTNTREVDFIRLLRYIAFLISILLPAIYVVLTTQHNSLLPTTFLFRLAVSRAGVPFPTVVEMILMQGFFELAREAGKRLPLQIGQALSVVSGLILGESAVGAGLASQTTVVVTGVYAICSFINPKLIGPSFLWSVAITAASVSFGLHGLYIMFMVFVSTIASLRTCSYPYLFPLGTADSFMKGSQDIISRGPSDTISYQVLKRK